MRRPLTAEIIQKEKYVEVHVAGTASHWDLLKIVHQLHKADPKKEKPDLWVLSSGFEVPFYSFPQITKGIMTLIIRNTIRQGANSAILAADELQKSKVELYCIETASLPFSTKAFTSRDEAMAWLLN